MESIEEYEEKRSPWVFLLTSFFVMGFIIMLILYFLTPILTEEFEFSSSKNANFNEASYYESNMQFYQDMRYPSREISYKIYDCPLQKKYNILWAMDILENETVLEFNEVSSGEEISVQCSDIAKETDPGIFVAGEGGVTEVVKTNNYNVILKGAVLLLRESECERPNVSLHELLHSLGFGHSDNKANIMYNYTKCRQTIGDDIPRRINALYEDDELPDLSIDEANAKVKSGLLDLNVSVRNHGLKDVGESELEVIVDDKVVETLDVSEMKIGHGSIITLTNARVGFGSIEELILRIEYFGEELDKSNNELVLVMKS